MERGDSSAAESRSEYSNTIVITRCPITTDSKRAKTSKQTRVHMTNLAKACDRHGMSDRAASAIATASLCDVGIVTPQDSSKELTRVK